MMYRGHFCHIPKILSNQNQQGMSFKNLFGYKSHIFIQEETQSPSRGDGAKYKRGGADSGEDERGEDDQCFEHKRRAGLPSDCL